MAHTNTLLHRKYSLGSLHMEFLVSEISRFYADVFPIINIMLSCPHKAIQEEKIKATLLLHREN